MNKDMIYRQDAIYAAKHAWAKGLEPTQYIEIVPPVQPRWIQCSVKMPEVGTSYLITRHGRVEIAYYEGENLW